MTSSGGRPARGLSSCNERAGQRGLGARQLFGAVGRSTVCKVAYPDGLPDERAHLYKRASRWPNHPFAHLIQQAASLARRRRAVGRPVARARCACCARCAVVVFAHHVRDLPLVVPPQLLHSARAVPAKDTAGGEGSGGGGASATQHAAGQCWRAYAYATLCAVYNALHELAPMHPLAPCSGTIDCPCVHSFIHSLAPCSPQSQPCTPPTPRVALPGGRRCAPHARR